MKLRFLLALLPCAAVAQNFQAAPRLTPILPRMDQPWTTTRPVGNPAVGLPLAPAGKAAPTQACSIPLLVVTPLEVDTAMIVRPQANAESKMPQVKPPAPSCADLQGR